MHPQSCSSHKFKHKFQLKAAFLKSRFLTFIVLCFNFVLGAIQFGRLHLPLPNFSQSGLQDGLPLVLQLFPLGALFCCLNDQTERNEQTEET